MSGILHRTIFIGKGVDGVMRQSHWSRVITEIGVMWEPRPFVNCDIAISDGFDATDMLSRIDAVESYDPGAQAFGDDNTIGGGLFPVNGY